MIPLYAVVSTIIRMKRTCQKCGRKQVVKSSQKNEIVPCKFCSAGIHPPRGKKCLRKVTTKDD